MRTEYQLTPATRKDLRNALTPCLALVAPSGMTEDERTEWFRAAAMALRDFPADLLALGASVAMTKADHPSKVVPAIVGECEKILASRRARYRKAYQAEQNRLIADAERLERERLAAPREWSPEDIRLLSSAMIAEKTGTWFTQSQVDAAFAR